MTQPVRRGERSAALTREAVGQAAVAMVADAGFDELTVRGVARRLAVSAPSLYEYVSSKDDLIDLVVAQILKDAELDWHPPADWEPLLRYAALWWHRLLREHEAVYMSVLRRPMAAPVSLDTVDRILTGLIRAGLPPQEAVAAYAEFFGYVIGVTALVRTREVARAVANTPAQDVHGRTRQLVQGLDATRYPGIHAASDSLVGLAGDEVVREGLESLIGGLKARLQQTIT